MCVYRYRNTHFYFVCGFFFNASLLHVVFCVLFYSPNITYWTTFSSSLCSSASLCEIAMQYFILWVLTVSISHWGLFRFFWCFIINSLLWASLYVSICLSVHASVTLPRWPKRKNARLKEMSTFIFKSYYKIVLWKACASLFSHPQSILFPISSLHLVWPFVCFQSPEKKMSSHCFVVQINESLSIFL